MPQVGIRGLVLTSGRGRPYTQVGNNSLVGNMVDMTFALPFGFSVKGGYITRVLGDRQGRVGPYLYKNGVHTTFVQ